jgi:hypothetical protein
MKVELMRKYMSEPSITVDFEAIPRKGETIFFNRDPDECSDDSYLLSGFYEDGEDWEPELMVADVLYRTGGGHPIILLEKVI